MTKILLSRSNTTLIAGVRDTASEAAQSLSALPIADNSKVIVVQINSLSDTDASTAAHSLEHDHGITGIDVVIANAGILTDLDPVTAVSPDAMRDSFQINTVAPLLLFRATLPLLLRAPNGNPRFIVPSSVAGSIELGPKAGPFASYGPSKAAVNYIVSEINTEHGADLTAMSIHPGLVDTQMGQRYAKASGYPIFTLEEGVRMFLEQVSFWFTHEQPSILFPANYSCRCNSVVKVEKVSRENQERCFIDYKGEPVPW